MRKGKTWGPRLAAASFSRGRESGESGVTTNLPGRKGGPSWLPRVDEGTGTVDVVRWRPDGSGRIATDNPYGTRFWRSDPRSAAKGCR